MNTTNFRAKVPVSAESIDNLDSSSIGEIKFSVLRALFKLLSLSSCLKLFEGHPDLIDTRGFMVAWKIFEKKCRAGTDIRKSNF